jgi:hypothetical protein
MKQWSAIDVAIVLVTLALCITTIILAAKI